MKITFHFRYFILAVALFFTEVMIATVFKDIYFVRAFLGDILVVILLYFLVLSFFRVEKKGVLLLGIFAFSVMIEVAQYFKIAEKLGFAEGSVMHIVIGNYFSWGDIICYAMGCLAMWGTEKIISSFSKNL